MNKSTLSITQHGAVRQILLDRPEALNALNGQMTCTFLKKKLLEF